MSDQNGCNVADFDEYSDLVKKRLYACIFGIVITIVCAFLRRRAVSASPVDMLKNANAMIGLASVKIILVVGILIKLMPKCPENCPCVKSVFNDALPYVLGVLALIWVYRGMELRKIAIARIARDDGQRLVDLGA